MSLVKTRRIAALEANAPSVNLGGLTATAAEINRVCDVSSKIVNATAATLAVTEALHEGRLVTLNRAAGITVTLPAATGSGGIYTFIVGTTVTSNTTIIKVANSSDIMGGVATMGSSGGTSISTGTAATSDTVTFNGTTSAGIAGTRVELMDVGVNLWTVSVHGVCSGVAITPFSATV